MEQIPNFPTNNIEKGHRIDDSRSSSIKGVPLGFKKPQQIPRFFISDKGSSISNHAAVQYQGSHYFFGGFTSLPNQKGALPNKIACLNSSSWSWSFIGIISSLLHMRLLHHEYNLGEINHAREGHGVIVAENQFIIAGGWGDFMTESCILEENKIHCTLQSSKLNHYAYYPILFIVSNDYKNCI